jgi:hypothetical protein
MASPSSHLVAAQTTPYSSLIEGDRGNGQQSTPDVSKDPRFSAFTRRLTSSLDVTIEGLNEAEFEKDDSGISPFEEVGIRRDIVRLQEPRRIVVDFEPHLRSEVIGDIRREIVALRDVLGGPGVAATVSALKRTLLEGYRATHKRQDSEYLATVVSALQDYFCQHWSTMTRGDLDQIAAILDEIEKQKSSLAPSLAASLVGKIASLRPGGLELPTSEELFWVDEE